MSIKRAGNAAALKRINVLNRIERVLFCGKLALVQVFLQDHGASGDAA